MNSWVAQLWWRLSGFSHRTVDVNHTGLRTVLVLVAEVGSSWLLISKADFSVRLTMHLNLIDCLIDLTLCKSINLWIESWINFLSQTFWRKTLKIPPLNKGHVAYKAQLTEGENPQPLTHDHSRNQSHSWQNMWTALGRLNKVATHWHANILPSRDVSWILNST